MALHRNQGKYDKNGDGRLSAGEWRNWYFRTYGHDIEIAERRALADAETEWESWLNRAVRVTQNAAEKFVDSACAILPKTQNRPKKLAWKALLYHVSSALIKSGLWNETRTSATGIFVSDRTFYPYRSVATYLVRISGINSKEDLKYAVKTRKPMYTEEGALTDSACGEFWTQIIAQLPPSSSDDPYCCDDDVRLNLDFDKRTSITDSAEDLLSNLLLLVHFFEDPKLRALAGKQNEDPLLQCFTKHWREAKGIEYNPLKFLDSAVARIVEQFPELKDEYKIEDLFNMYASDLLKGIYTADPQRAIAMWRSLPQEQKPLQDDFLSEDFFYILDFLWYYKEFDEDAIAPLLDAIREDDVLAEMVFRSRYVCTLHLYLIQAALEQRRTDLAEHLYALLQSNPLPREEWREDPDEFKSLMEKRADTEDNTPIYHYCFVQVGNNRPYAYLTAGLPVKRGDRVRVPYGKKNEPKEGIVRSVGDYTRDTAPWPPEKTKRVLEILPKPQETAKKEAAEPKPQQVEKEATKPEAPPITEEAKPAEAAPAAKAPQGGTPPQKRRLVPILIAATLVIIAGCVLLNGHNQRVAWEQQYQTAADLFAEGRYKEAAELAEDVPKNIAEQPALLTVAKAGVLLDTDTEESLCDGLDLLKCAWDLGSYSEQGSILQAKLTDRLQETFYEKAITLLHRGDPYAALSYLQKLEDYKDPSLKAELAEQLQEALYEKAITLLHKGDSYTARSYLLKLGDYKDAATILLYTHALIDSQSFNVIIYRWALESLQAIPPDYNGEFAEEIAALRDALPGKIAEQEQLDAERAATQAQQQQQKPKPPQTFNYGGSSTDTGPGSGHSLREDYDDPEDLYEDGDYDDLDEAWDEWEEGW